MLYRRERSQYWWVSVMRDGKRIRRSTGETDRARAEIVAEQMTGYTVREVLQEYVRHLGPRGERARYASDRLCAVFGKQMMLTPAHLSGYRRERQASPGTIRKELSILCSAYNHCAGIGWNVVNPVAGKLGKKPEPRVRWITREEADRLVRCARKVPKAPDLWRFIVLGLNTGMRRDEMLRLEWSRVDLENAVVHLDRQKNGKPGVVPLNRRAVEALTGMESERWVFERGGERIQNMRKGFASACRMAGIKDFRVHDLRHTCASWMVQAGVPIRDVAEVLRHSDIRTTMIYAHLSPDSARDAVKALEVCHKV